MIHHWELGYILGKLSTVPSVYKFHVFLWWDILTGPPPKMLFIIPPYHLCLSTFHHYDKIPEVSNLQQGKAKLLTVSDTSIQGYFAPLPLGLWQSTMLGQVWWSEVLTPWQPRDKERRIWGTILISTPDGCSQWPLIPSFLQSPIHSYLLNNIYLVLPFKWKMSPIGSCVWNLVPSWWHCLESSQLLRGKASLEEHVTKSGLDVS